MKRIIYGLLVLSVSLVSCAKYLDQVPQYSLDIEKAFSTMPLAEQFLANVYDAVPNEYRQRDPGQQNAGVWTCGSDEAEFTWGDEFANNINNASYDASSGVVGSYWTNYYRAIRAASVFLQNADKISVIGSSRDMIIRHKAEARALRAIYYFYLMRIYGPVVLMGEEPVAVDANLQIPRSSYDECTAYVVSELEKAAVDLPLVWDASIHAGRITPGVCYAIRAQALMYAASPLFNGNPDYASLVNKDGKQLISQTYDPNKWKIAADAYRDFLTQFVPSLYDLNIDMTNGVIDPYMSYKNAIIKDWNKESIFIRVSNSVGPWQYALTPHHDGAPGGNDSQGGAAIDPTQEMVDAYFTANGRSIDDPQSGYVSSGTTLFQAPLDTKARDTYNQWVNREPRFYASITYNNSLWLNTQNGEIITQLYYNGNSGHATTQSDYSKTGYVARKAMGFSKWNINNRVLTLIRLAEVYLNYAECLNESQPGNADILKYVNLIRTRAGIPTYGSAELEAPSGQGEVREAIRKERRVELAFENSRFFDVRRWKIAEQTDNAPMHGLTYDSNLPAFLNVRVFENRVFKKQHYLFPIPSGDINNDKQLVQNTGW